MVKNKSPFPVLAGLCAYYFCQNTHTNTSVAPKHTKALLGNRHEPLGNNCSCRAPAVIKADLFGSAASKLQHPNRTHRYMIQNEWKDTKVHRLFPLTAFEGICS